VKGPQPKGLSGYVYVLIATVIWSGNFIVARVLLDAVPPVTLAMLRWSIAVLALTPVGLPALWRDRQIVLKHVWLLTGAGFLGVTMFNTLVYIAAYTSEALNMSLMAITSPLFVVILARLFLGEPLTLQRVTGVITASVGVILLVTGGNLKMLLTLTFTEGDLWMLLAAVLFAGYTILVRKKPPEMSLTVFISATFGLGLAMLLPWWLWELAGPVSIRLTTTAIMSVIYLGLGPALAAFLCWNRAVTIIGPGRAAMVYYSLPIFSGLEAFIILGEPVTAAHAISGALILAGILIATRNTTDPTRA
jgi:drug/metabolite transporter (DMT)-like permease